MQWITATFSAQSACSRLSTGPRNFRSYAPERSSCCAHSTPRIYHLMSCYAFCDHDGHGKDTRPINRALSWRSTIEMYFVLSTNFAELATLSGGQCSCDLQRRMLEIERSPMVLERNCPGSPQRQRPRRQVCHFSFYRALLISSGLVLATVSWLEQLCIHPPSSPQSGRMQGGTCRD